MGVRTVAGQPKMQARMSERAAVALRGLAEDNGGWDELATALVAADRRTRATRGASFTAWLQVAEVPDTATAEELQERENELIRRERVVRRWLRDAPLAEGVLDVIRQAGIEPGSLISAVKECGTLRQLRTRMRAEVAQLQHEKRALEAAVDSLRAESLGLRAALRSAVTVAAREARRGLRAATEGARLAAEELRRAAQPAEAPEARSVPATASAVDPRIGRKGTRSPKRAVRMEHGG